MCLGKTLESVTVYDQALEIEPDNPQDNPCQRYCTFRDWEDLMKQ